MWCVRWEHALTNPRVFKRARGRWGLAACIPSPGAILPPQFFGYWDVLGAHTDYIGTHHAEDHKSHSLHVNEFGWYLADCAGLANYRSATGGTLDSYTSENLSENMFNTIKNFEAAIDIIQERQKQNKHPLMISKEHHSQYQGVFAARFKPIAQTHRSPQVCGLETIPSLPSSCMIHG
jgi:hypothetical protein